MLSARQTPGYDDSNKLRSWRPTDTLCSLSKLSFLTNSILFFVFQKVAFLFFKLYVEILCQGHRTRCRVQFLTKISTIRHVRRMQRPRPEWEYFTENLVSANVSYYRFHFYRLLTFYKEFIKLLIFFVWQNPFLCNRLCNDNRDHYQLIR